jgi:5'(3')-deoxyribonucleotidase
VRVGLDVDEVVAQLHLAWSTAYNETHGTRHTGEFKTWDEASTPEWYALLVPSLYDKVLPYPGTRPAVESIRMQGHEVFFVTSCGANNETAFAKEKWLRAWGFLRENEGLMSGHMIATQDKRHAPVDVLVDDHIKNVDSFLGWSVLQTRSHNRNITTNKSRIDHLADFVEMLWQRRVA